MSRRWNAWWFCSSKDNSQCGHNPQSGNDRVILWFRVWFLLLQQRVSRCCSLVWCLELNFPLLPSSSLQQPRFQPLPNSISLSLQKFRNIHNKVSKWVKALWLPSKLFSPEKTGWCDPSKNGPFYAWNTENIIEMHFISAISLILQKLALKM